MPSKTAKPTKSESIVKLLKRPVGATITQLQKATGWKPHSVRAALTDLRKKGYKLPRGEGVRGDTVYRIAKDAT